MLKWVDGLIPWEDQAERQRLLAAAGAFGCVAAASLLARIAGDTLLLSTYGREVLASLYLGTAGIVGVSSLVFGMLAGRFATRRLVAGSAVILIFLLLGVWGVLQTGVAPVRIAAYLMADFTVSGSMLLFWIFFGEVFDARKARRFLGFTGAAGTITCMIAASLVAGLTPCSVYPNYCWWSPSCWRVSESWCGGSSDVKPVRLPFPQQVAPEDPPAGRPDLARSPSPTSEHWPSS
jgi:hypothetical protein